jgi:hypothetical protein
MNENGEPMPIRDRPPQQRLLKDLIRPLETVLLKTNEDVRLAKLEVEEDYFVNEYQKQLAYEKQAKQNQSDCLSFDCENSNSNYGKKRRGKQRRNYNEASNELIQRYRPRAHDTDEETGLGGEVIRHSHNMDMDEDTADQFIDIDDDSNTQHSISANPIATVSRANNRSSGLPAASTAASNYYLDPLDLSDSVSSEYSDWAEEDGRKTLKAPPRRGTRRTNRRNSKRPLKIQDDEDEEENGDAEEDSPKTSRAKKATTAKKLKRIVSSDEEEANNTKKETDEQAWVIIKKFLISISISAIFLNYLIN